MGLGFYNYNRTDLDDFLLMVYLGALAAVSITKFVTAMVAQHDAELRDSGKYHIVMAPEEKPEKKRTHEETVFTPPEVQLTEESPSYYYDEDENEEEKEEYDREDYEEEYARNHGLDDYDEDEGQGWGGMSMM